MRGPGAFGAEAPVKRYTSAQIRTAWHFMCRGDKEGLRKRDIERLVRTFRPTMAANELEQLLGPIKSRVTLNSLKQILSTDLMSKVCRRERDCAGVAG